MKNQWFIDCYPEAGGFDTLAEAKMHCQFYTDEEKRDLIGTVIYRAGDSGVGSSCEIKGMEEAGYLRFGRVRLERL